MLALSVLYRWKLRWRWQFLSFRSCLLRQPRHLRRITHDIGYSLSPTQRAISFDLSSLLVHRLTIVDIGLLAAINHLLSSGSSGPLDTLCTLVTPTGTNPAGMFY